MKTKTAQAVPVLMYHWFYDLENGVAPNDMSRNWISAQEFEAQMRFLHDNGYYYPSWQELRSWLDGKTELPEKSVVLTDDDAYETFFSIALPILQNYAVPFTSFVPTALDANKPQLIRAYEIEPFLTFQSHSDALHAHWDICLEKSVTELEEDIIRSVAHIGNYEAFAYPFGQHTREYRQALRQNGFLLAFTTVEGSVRRGMDPYALPRVRMNKGMTVADFARALGSGGQ